MCFLTWFFFVIIRLGVCIWLGVCMVLSSVDWPIIKKKTYFQVKTKWFFFGPFDMKMVFDHSKICCGHHYKILIVTFFFDKMTHHGSGCATDKMCASLRTDWEHEWWFFNPSFSSQKTASQSEVRNSMICVASKKTKKPPKCFLRIKTCLRPENENQKNMAQL
jgi:hypothetical protein